MADLCIGAAEIGHLYLFSGVGSGAPVAANIAMPTVDSGTIVITLLVSAIVFKEALAWTHIAGSVLIVAGIALLFLKPGAVAG